MRNVCTILIGKPEGKRPLERTGCKCKDNVKADLKDIR
jgi:hypothetical protein